MKRLSKTIFAALLVVLLAFALVGCQSTAKAEAEAPVTVVVPAPAPVVVAPEPAPVVVETPAPEAPVVVADEPITVTVDYFGYQLIIKSFDGKATIVYPSFITDEEVADFCGYIVNKYGSWVDGVTYAMPFEGYMVLNYPKGISKADRAYAIEVVLSELSDYVAKMEAASVEAPVRATISYFGYTAQVVAYDGNAVVNYPSFVTDEEVSGFCAYIVKKYGSWVNGVTFSIPSAGELNLTYPKGISKADREYAIQVAVDELGNYVGQLFAAEEAKAVAAAKAAADAKLAAEQAKAAQIAAEAKAAEEAALKAAAEAAAKGAKEEVVFPYGVKMIEKNSDGAKAFDLFIVHTNDTHARIVPSDGGMGYAKLATLLKMGRSITDNILVLDAGDVTHGTNLANMFQGETVGVLLDLLGYDAVAPGNHDFNYGKDRLIQAAEIAEEAGNLKVLSANIVDENGYFVFQPYQLYDFNGFTVAVIGLTTPDTVTMSHPNNTAGLIFIDPTQPDILADAQWAVATARQQGVDFVVVLGHIGLDATGSGLTSDVICQKIDGIDLFVDGHSHTTLPAGSKVNGATIVSAGDYLRNVGVVQVSVSNDKVVSVTPMLVSAEEVLDPSKSALAKQFGITEVPADPEVQAYIDYMNKKLEAEMNIVIANVPVLLDGARENVRTKQTNLSKMICTAMTEASGADFTITNGGGIRASIQPGKVTVGDVNSVLPFTNYLTVVEATGADVYAALEHGYSLLPVTNGAFSQTDLQVVYSKFSPAGSRIKRVLLNGQPLDLNATYKVATNDFMAAGGDGYTMFGKVVQEGQQLNEILINYLTKNYPVK